MIPDTEIKQKAREKGVPVSTIERDYVQNWLLASLSSLPMVLKGGTGIKKVYIEDYRFSDDLDFTLIKKVDKNELDSLIKEAIEKIKEESGINFSENVTLEEDDNGFKIDVYFQITQKGSNKTKLKIDITRCEVEKIFLPINTKKIIHPYSDELDVNVSVKVYSLEEIMSEKIRSLFQRTRPRDLYDVWYLWDKVEKGEVFKILFEKFKIKGVAIDINDFENRIEDFQKSWEKSLSHQLKELPNFKEIFSTVIEGVRRMYVEKIKISRKNILTGEIGALLHDIGKCHPDFVKSKSIEKTASDNHAQIDKFLDDYLVSYIKVEKFKFKINNIESDIYSLITKHHDKDLKDPKDQLVKFLQACDQKDSADDKGIVRRKQGLDNTYISSPFGYRKEKIDLMCLQKRFDDLQDNLKGLFKNYISDEIDLSYFRKGLLNNLKTSFSHALGETRIPANDVTLWDHSYSTAALFKTILAGEICRGYIDKSTKKSVEKWRIFGVCWKGEEFVNQGQKIAEIQKRAEILDEIKSKLKMKFEDEIPIGNAIYEDTNGIYFTFPDLTTQSKELAKSCSEEALNIINDISANELWPFFTLSDPSSTLTIIANELDFSSKKRKIPRMKPILFLKNDDPIPFENPPLFTPEEGEDVCPVCKVRTKPVSNERCNICEKRRNGRLEEWFNNRENTIWTDEVADKNNRVALLTLKFGLDKWLGGTMIGTIFSQTFEEWLNSKKTKKDNNCIVEKSTIQLLEEANINTTIQPNRESVYFLLGEFIRNIDNKGQNKDTKKAAQILDTFFQDVDIAEKQLEKHIKNIMERIGEDKLTKENLAAYLFTQNPSPARIFRIWRETEEFFELIIKEIINKIYPTKWKRLKFFIDNNNLKSKLKRAEELKENTPYIIEKEKLDPQELLVLHTKNGEFYTIESLDKFKFEDKIGENAVCEALKQGFNYLALEDKPNENLLKRLKFSIDYDDLKSKLKQGEGLKENTLYIIKIKGLEPETLLVLHTKNGEFYTIEFLNKFKFEDKTGENVVGEALKNGFKYLALEDKPNKNLLKEEIEIEKENIKGEESNLKVKVSKIPEEYIPLIEINKSPLSLRMIVPASDSIKILELTSKLYNERFGKVIGKLPLNAGLLVVKRKFPLYVLLDAGERLFYGQEFTKPERMDPWWNIERIDKYYGFYPIKELDEKEKYTLDDLGPLSKVKQYSLYPGYFDFDLLLGTDDRYKIRYEEKRRADEEYKLFSKRPYYFYQISEMIDLWEILKNNLSSSQINFIEESLTGKLREWRDVKDTDKEGIFKIFVEATLKDAFGDRWKNFRRETQGFILNSAFNRLLLDTIVLFRHIIKEKENEENE